MDIWLEKSIKLVNENFIDINRFNYKSFVFVFYNYFSNRNLAILISRIFEVNELDIYFEIDKIIANEDYNLDEVNLILNRLQEKRLEEWLEDMS